MSQIEPNYCPRKFFLNPNSDYPNEKGDIVLVNRETMQVHDTIDSKKGLPSVTDLGEDIVPYTRTKFDEVFVV
ncbi:hypothetical protein HYW74_02235 [Candidatus Pacearchaeota archaeon]|nr:hypothetical protein [Candidatus Pacearchaeota archaeon]